MFDIKEILKINPKRASRKNIIEPIATCLSINCIAFKNKQLLYNEIVKQISPSNRCDNSCDPITLENLDDIDAKFLYEWKQNGKQYGADIRSLKAMIEKDTTVLPWAIDFSTGFDQAQNRDEYLKRFDMKHVPGLIEDIKSFNLNECDAYSFEYDKVPCRTKHRFLIENSTSEYISHLLDHLENCKDFRRLYHRVLIFLCNQYNGEMHHGNDVTLKNVINLNLLHQLSHISLNQNYTSNPLELLMMIINTINENFEGNSQILIDFFFVTLNALKND